MNSEGTIEPNDHGTVRSYIIGFILSLVFTAIPYYVVVNQTIAGTALLIAIIAIAVLQMVIQIIFFLHLGREKGPRWQLYFFVGTVGTIVLVVVASLWIMSHLHYNMSPADSSKKLIEKEGIYQLAGEKTGACHGSHQNFVVTISDNQLYPSHVTAQLCDTLTFKNQNSTASEITFGTHPQHGKYGTISEVPVRASRNKTITLNQSGTFQYHDHLNPVLEGSFTVAE